MQFRPYIYLLFILPSIVSGADGEEVFTESVVIFNTNCARCHEAECSGRMSFHMPYEMAANHIVRHYNDAAGKDWMQEQLYQVLNHMKEKCAYYPMNVTVPHQRIWDREILDGLSSSLGNNYFIPAGRLSPGIYQLSLTLEEDAKVTMHIISEEFDMVLEDCFLSKNRQVFVLLKIEEASHYYVRIYLREPVSLTQLTIADHQ